jgi:hypothetical protein
MWYKIQEALAIIFLIAVVVFIIWASVTGAGSGSVSPWMPHLER